MFEFFSEISVHTLCQLAIYFCYPLIDRDRPNEVTLNKVMGLCLDVFTANQFYPNTN